MQRLADALGSPGRNCVLRLHGSPVVVWRGNRWLRRFLVSHLFTVMLDCASGGCADEPMVTCDMACDSAHGGTFQTSFGMAYGWRCERGDSDCESE